MPSSAGTERRSRPMQVVDLGRSALKPRQSPVNSTRRLATPSARISMSTRRSIVTSLRGSSTREPSEADAEAVARRARKRRRRSRARVATPREKGQSLGSPRTNSRVSVTEAPSSTSTRSVSIAATGRLPGAPARGRSVSTTSSACARVSGTAAQDGMLARARSAARAIANVRCRAVTVRWYAASANVARPDRCRAALRDAAWSVPSRASRCSAIGAAPRSSCSASVPGAASRCSTIVAGKRFEMQCNRKPMLR